MSLVSPGITRVVFAVDIESYSTRSHLEQMREQSRLVAVVTHALSNAGTEYLARQDSGDGMLLILPEGIDQAWVVPRLLTGLREALELDNRGRDQSGRMRMRASVGEGMVHVAATGFASGTVIDVCRLLNSGPLKQALRDDPGRDLVTAVTQHTYEQVVEHHYPGLNPSTFHQVEINIPDKAFKRLAWIDAAPPTTSKTLPATADQRPAATADRRPSATPAQPTAPTTGRRPNREAALTGLSAATTALEGVYLLSELKHHHHDDRPYDPTTPEGDDENAEEDMDDTDSTAMDDDHY
ncbi:MAG: hypothetical protein H5T76_20855 [Streptomyces sp.]|nr:hypothetical protein [Streptomyces sp.]